MSDIKINPDAFSVIDLEYWAKFSVEGLETVIGKKEEKLVEFDEKETKFWNIVNGKDFTITLTTGTKIKGFELKKLGGYKVLCSKFIKYGYKAFDDELFKEVDAGYGQKETITQFKAVDRILDYYGLKKPKNKEAIKVYRDIFWVTRRSFQVKEFYIPELEELKKLLNAKTDEDNSFDPTSLNDFLEQDETNIDFFGLE